MRVVAIWASTYRNCGGSVQRQRLETIFRTNLHTAYANGHWDSIQRTKERRPYLRYAAVMDDRTRPEHRAWHGTVLPVDDPWWETHAPPNGWNCRCRVIAVSERMLQRQGWQVSERPASPTRPVLNKRTGEVAQVPVGIDLGWDYNPGNGAARRAEVSRLFAERLETAFPGEGAGKIYEWDPAKRKASRKKHGVDFAAMVYFDWGTAEDDDPEVEDVETRQNVYGNINGRLHRATYTERDGKVRMISLRKANKREARRYNKRR